MTQTLESRVISAKSNSRELDALLTEYRPFILSAVISCCGKADDDCVQAGFIAFAQAVESFNGEKGKFLSLAKLIIKRRVIDLQRKAYSNRELTVLDAEEDESLDVINSASAQLHSMNTENEERREEIAMLVKELGARGITLSQLSASSPRHEATRAACKRAVSLLLSEPLLFEDFTKKNRLPLTELANRLGIKKKLLEDHRRYIVAALIVHSGDFQYIKDYIKLDREVK